MAGLIYISIASYRDPECQWTIKSMFESADHPERLRVGVVWQADLGLDRACFEWQCPFPRQTRTIFLHFTEAKGPCFARALAQTLYEDEEFFLQIDSHMRFVPGWDGKLIGMLRQCELGGTRKAVISTYPTGFELDQELPTDKEPTILCAQRFGPDGMLRLHGRPIRDRKLLVPEPEPRPDAPVKLEPGPGPGSAATPELNFTCPRTLFVAAGFLFARGHVVRDVPYDRSLKHLFFGEEIALSARLFTAGWDFFAPSENVIYHLWSRAHRPTFRELGSGSVSGPAASATGTPASGSRAPALESSACRPEEEPEPKSAAGHDSTAAEAKSREPESEPARLERLSQARVRALLGMPAGPKGPSDASEVQTPTAGAGSVRRGVYGAGSLCGLGDARSLEEYEAFCGVDFSRGAIAGHARTGGQPASWFADEPQGAGTGGPKITQSQLDLVLKLVAGMK